MPMGANFGDVDNDGFRTYIWAWAALLYRAAAATLLRNDEGK